VDRLNEIAVFVSSFGHFLASAPTETIVTAHNYARSGPLATAADESCRQLGRMWPGRDPHPPEHPTRTVELRTLQGHTSWANVVAVTPDGTCAVSGSLDHTLRVWDLHSGESLHVLGGHTSWISDVAVTPDSNWAISASDDGSVRLWDLRRGQERMVLTGHD